MQIISTDVGGVFEVLPQDMISLAEPSVRGKINYSPCVFLCFSVARKIVAKILKNDSMFTRFSTKKSYPVNGSLVDPIFECKVGISSS